MSSTIFFKLGSSSSSGDLSAFADIQNYNVNKADVYQDWTDGNWISHREIVRTRISGTVTLGFKTATDWNAFISLLNSTRTAAGYFPVTVWVNNTGASESIDAFLDLAGTGKWDLANNRFWRVITISVTQR